MRLRGKVAQLSPFFILDVCGTADDYAITIATESTETIDGIDEIKIVSPYGSKKLFSNGTHWFVTF